MIKHIKCDIFESGADVICHQVNCQGEMNTGVAAQVRQRYPWVYATYKYTVDFQDEIENPRENLLGVCQYVFIDETREVINIFGQVEYGYDGNCYTDYEALKRAFEALATDECNIGKTLAFPYKMGCHRGGGDWDIVYKLICDAFEDSQCDVLICEYDEEAEKERIRSRLLSIGKALLYNDDADLEERENENV